MKKSTKISIALFSVGFVMCIIGTVAAGKEIKDKILDKGINIWTRRNGIKITSKMIDNKYDKDIKSIVVNSSNDDITFMESDDEYVHVQYDKAYKDIINVTENGDELNVKIINNSDSTLDNDDYDDEDYDYDYEEDYDEDSQVSIDENGINVKGDDGSTVKIDRDGIKVNDGEDKVDVDFDGINVEDGENKVTINGKGINVNSNVGTIVVCIPKKYKGNITCNLSNGDAILDNVDVKDVNVYSANGDIELSGIVAQSISLNTANGDIEVKKIDATKSISLESNNGDIEGTFVKSIKEYNLTTQISGDTDLPSESPSDGADLFIKTSRGDVDVDFFG